MANRNNEVNHAIEEVIFMHQYEALLLELLRRLDEKADRLISLLEVRRDADRCGDRKKEAPLGGKDQGEPIIRIQGENAHTEEERKKLCKVIREAIQKKEHDSPQ